MFDSVYPTRTARFGVALVPSGVLKLKNVSFTEDFRCAACNILSKILSCIDCAVALKSPRVQLQKYP